MKKRIQSFDYLRVIAMLMVLNQHFIGTFDSELAYYSGIGAFLWNGHCAVAVFFVISGFALSYSIMISGRATTVLELLKKILKRYFKFVVPIFFVCTCVYFLDSANIFTIIFQNFDGDVSGIDLDAVSKIPDIFIDSFWGIVFEGNTRFNFAFWTMKYEWFASIYIICLVNLIHRKKIYIRWMGYVLSFGMALLIDPIYCVFGVGVIIADIYVKKESYPLCVKSAVCWNRKGKSTLIWLGCIVAFVLGGYPSYGQASFWDNVVKNNRLIMQGMHTLAALIMVIAALWVYNIKTNNKIDHIVTGISDITYEMYLIHVVVIYSIGIYVYKIGNSVLLAYISVLLGTVCCAYSLHYITKKILWNTKESEKKDEKSGNHRSLL